MSMSAAARSAMTTALSAALSATLFVAGGAAAPSVCQAAPPIEAAPRPPSWPLLSGNTGVLPVGARAALESQLRELSSTLGSPVAIRIVTAAGRHVGRAEVQSLAQQSFEEMRLGDQGTDAILLLVAVDQRQAAIETGKGQAGLVPEIDARVIVTRLTHRLSASNLVARLSSAIRELAASTQATRQRRQPLPSDEPALPAPASDATATPSAETAPDGGVLAQQAGDPLVPGSKPRSRLPWAIAAAGLFLLSLAMFKRRQLAANRERLPAVPPPARRGDGEANLRPQPPTRPPHS